MFRQMIPVAIRRTVRDRWFLYELSRVRSKLSRNPGGIPSPADLQALSRAWGNVEWAANVDYLLEVCRQARDTQGAILECGSGLTTVLLGICAQAQSARTVSLEHLPEWRQRVGAVVERAAIDKVQLIDSPLVAYEGFDWYEKPSPTAPFSLVICDGPPGETVGRRFGLLPVMADQLADGCIIVLDDAERPGEIETLQRWQDGWNVQVECFGQENPPARALVTFHN